MHARSLSIASSLFVCAALFSTLACDEPGARRPGVVTPLSEQTDGNDGLELNERAYVVDAELGAEVYVSPDELVFYGGDTDESLERAPGDILVNGSQTGFLRKVETVEHVGADIVMRTSEAALGDVFLAGGFSRDFRPFSEGQPLVVDDYGNPASAGGIMGPGELPTPANSGISFSGGRLDIKDHRLLSAYGVDVTLDEGHIAFDPSLNVSAEFGWWDIERFTVEARGSLDAALDLRITSDGYDKEIHESVKLWESPKNAFYTFVGPVPVVVVSQLELAVNADLSIDTELDFRVGASASSFIAVGGVYEDGAWTKINDHTFSYDFEGPTITAQGTVDAQVNLEAKLLVKFYDAAGPWITVSPGVRAEAAASLDSLEWLAQIGVESRFGGSVKLPGTEELGFEGQLFSWWHTVAEGTL